MASVFLAAIFLFIISILIYLVKSIIEHNKNNAQLPSGPTPWPIFGNLNLISGKNLHPKLMEIGKRYGGIFRLQVGWRSSVWITSYKIFREAVVNNSWTFAGRPHDLRTGLSEPNDFPGIAASGIEKDEKDIRKFVLVGLRNFGFGKTSMQESILQHSLTLNKEIRNINGAPFNPRAILANTTANVISTILLGKTFPPGDPGLDIISTTMTAGLKVFLDVQMDEMFPFMKLIPRKSRALSANAFKIGKDFLRDVVSEHMLSHQPNAPQDFIDLWLDQDGVTFAPKRLPSALMDLFLGGFETTTTTFQWIFAMLLHHPEIQDKIHAELDREVGRGIQITLDHRDNLLYTEAVILETLRIYPLVPFAAPHLAVEAGVLGGHKIPAGTRIMLHLWAIHHDSDLWDEPEEFRPERFIEDGKIVYPDCFVPFSAGRRSCIGEQLARKELFLFFANLMQEFTLTRDPAEPLPSLEVMQGIVIYPTPFNVVALVR